MEYKEVYESWLANPYFDEATKQELLSIKDDENEIKERFYADLEFGTAGLRGVIGAGTNRMNVYVVRKTTQGLANYIIKQNAADKGVAIAFDSRRMSTEFANEAALCLAANGIKAYIFDALRPTPDAEPHVRLSNNSKIQSDIDGIFIFDFFNTIFIFVFHMNYMCSPLLHHTLFKPHY